jgi:hypothetical protein
MIEVRPRACYSLRTFSEVHRLAATVEAWWPAIEAGILTGYSNDQVSHCTSSCCFGWWCGMCPLSGP